MDQPTAWLPLPPDHAGVAVAEPPADEVSPDIVKILGGAVMALRSYQYGNAAPDLAKEAADAGEEALRGIGFPPGFMAMEGAQ